MTGLPSLDICNTGKARRSMPTLALSLLISLALAGCVALPTTTEIIPATLAPTTIAPEVEHAQSNRPSGLCLPWLVQSPATRASPTPLDLATPTAASAPATLPLKLPTAPDRTGAAHQPAARFEIGVYAARAERAAYVAIGSRWAAPRLKRDANRIVRLPRLNGDGVADGIQVVADNLVRPSSLAFYNDGSLYVGRAPPAFCA